MVTKACMPLVLKEKGRFVIMASMAGRFAFLNSSYCISKYGVEAFSDVLRRELYRTGFKVQIIEPGSFKTEIWKPLRKMAENKMDNLSAATKSQLPGDAVDKISTVIGRVGDSATTNLSPVVDAYCHAITAKFPQKRYLVGFDAKYIFRMLWNLPECMSDFIIDWQGAVSI